MPVRKNTYHCPQHRHLLDYYRLLLHRKPRRKTRSGRDQIVDQHRTLYISCDSSSKCNPYPPVPSWLKKNFVRDVTGNNRPVTTHIPNFIIDCLPHLGDSPFNEVHEYGIVYVVVFAYRRTVGVDITLFILRMTVRVRYMQGLARQRSGVCSIQGGARRLECVGWATYHITSLLLTSFPSRLDVSFVSAPIRPARSPSFSLPTWGGVGRSAAQPQVTIGEKESSRRRVFLRVCGVLEVGRNNREGNHDVRSERRILALQSCLGNCRKGAGNAHVMLR